MRSIIALHAALLNVGQTESAASMIKVYHIESVRGITSNSPFSARLPRIIRCTRFLVEPHHLDLMHPLRNRLPTRPGFPIAFFGSTS